MPRLRRNRRIETRWGVKYYAAVKNAVFISSQAHAYVPPPPPLTVKECFPECENLYMCTQCQDCFHFRGSFEDHIARKSWILGYWCHDCFVTTCKHNSMEGELCSGCRQSDNEKRFYLKHQGLRRDQKHGAVRVFYNQCQFFAHLKAHNVNLKAQNVYMGDLMLMPLPTNMDAWSPEIDLICEALMEHTFVSKIHIMDWLKDKNVLDNWWKLANNEAEDDDPVAAIVKRYKGRFYFKPLEIPIDKLFFNSKLSHSVSNNNNSIDSDTDAFDSVDQMNTSADTTSVSYESFVENEDSPCTGNEVAFVDCGVSPKYLEPEKPDKPEIPLVGNKRGNGATNSLLQSSRTLAKKLENDETQSNSIVPKAAAMSYGNIIITPKRNVKELHTWRNPLDKCNKSITPINVVAKSNIDDKADRTFSDDASNAADPLSKTDSDTADATKADARKPKLNKFKQNVHMLAVVKSGQALMAIKSPKNVKPIINNNKNIVLITQPIEKNAVSNSTESAVRLVPEEKLLETNQEKLAEAKTESVLKSTTGGMKYKAHFPANRVTCRNEKKHVTNQAYNFAKNPTKVVPTIQKMVQLKSVNGVPPALIPLNSPEIENTSNKEKSSSFQGDVITPLTPSPSPSELSSSSSCDVQSKQSSSVKVFQKIDTLPTIQQNNAADDANNTSESLLFYKGNDQELYLDVKFLKQKPIFTIVDTFSMITRCREEMLNEFFHLPRSELKKRSDHLQEISEEISRVMSFVTESVINENLKAVLILQTVLKHCIEKSVKDSNSNTDEEDVMSYDWESEYKRADEKPICKGCNKIRKPKNYIPAFSRPATNDVYCSCYRHVCHKCDTYQGNSTRFVAHQTFHDKEKPFLCPDCYRKFTTYRSLEVHTWTTCFHTLKKRVLGCKVCEVDGFQDMESVARHFALMHSTSKVACDKCHIVLPSYSKYARHYEDKHSDAADAQKQPIRLVLCKLGRCIVRCEDYMSHMEKHSAVQVLIWFKCPFCTFIHVEAQRIISHLQSTHEARLQELISSRFLHSLLRADNPQLNKFMNANFCGNDGTVVPRIVSARTITSEVFERGADGPEDYATAAQFSQQTDDTSSSSSFRSSSWPKILDVKSLASLTMNRPSYGENGMEERRTKSSESEETEQTESERLMGIEEESDEIDDARKDKARVSSDPSNIESLQAVLSSLNIEKDQDEESCDKTEMTKTTVSDDASSDVRVKRQSLAKPPPLTRIPVHAAEADKPKKLGQTLTKARSYKTKYDLPQRIALNGPTDSDEIYNFSCHLCGESLNTSKSIVNRHFRSKHSQDYILLTLSVSLLRMSYKFINGGYKDLLCNKRRKTEYINVPAAKRRRRWTPKKYSDGKNGNFSGVGLCVKQVTAKDGEGNFRCKKCDQSCSDMANLREHIASNHRIRGRYLVCLECGDNFVVASSLQMHLKAFHGIEDPITYMAQNTSYAPEDVDNLESGGKSIEANQCHVCMAVFEDKAAVDKHLRVHGMAFLNRKRIEAQNAMKSPEKKTEDEEEAEEEKQVPTKTSTVEAATRKDNPAETILDRIAATI
ncbi:uncharacterized protein LOC108631950 isoform X2 [Ceratina calcarata]|nr:uncharacterized protein LOC108631950 isoform X2 [Ceratina calcarata]XP_017891693.1 uncharacterized protein LOC108631950 isoform X2 [Ceratina calcarata]